MLATAANRTGDLLTITISAGGNTDAVLTVVAGVYQLDGAPADDATVANTRQIQVNGFAGADSFTLNSAVTLTKGLDVNSAVDKTTINDNISGTGAGFEIDINSPLADIKGVWQTLGGDVDLATPASAVTLTGDFTIDTQSGTTPVNAGSVALRTLDGAFKLRIDATGGVGGLGGSIALNGNIGVTTALSQLDALTTDSIFMLAPSGKLLTDGPVTLKAAVLGVNSQLGTMQTIDTEADGAGNGGDVTLDVAIMTEVSGTSSQGILQINTAPGVGGTAGKVTLPPVPGFVQIGQAAGSVIYQDTYGSNKILINTTAVDLALADYGDAPTAAQSGFTSSYPTTLAADGPRHLPTGLYLGAQRDVESNGAPNATATGDDVAAADDEDGVVFTSPLVPSFPASVQVVLSQNGVLDAWIDFNRDGDFTDAGEKIFGGQALTAGSNALTFNVPAAPASSVGNTFSRFRVSSTGTALPTGLATDGEVEDHLVAIVATAPDGDHGDAPDTYLTLNASGGPVHTIVGNSLILGTARDGEADGQPNATATGDDFTGVPDDEDGVTIPPLVPATTATLTVVASQAGLLNAWIDFGNDGSFATAGDQIATNQPVIAGPNSILVSVPAGAVISSPFARFRLNSTGGLAPGGSASDGEVEDHQVSIVASIGADFGDAPDSYGTLAIDGGPSHTITGNSLTLGAARDNEINGQPNATATGDDIVGVPDDEDGVTIPTLIAGSNATIQVVAGQAGVLNAWVDFNIDGDFTDFGEQIATNRAVAAGANSLSVPVPIAATTGTSFGRFRLNSTGLLGPLGPAADGEVEDHQVTIATSVSPILLQEDFNGVGFDPRIDTESGNFNQVANELQATRTPGTNAIATFDLGPLPASGVTVNTDLRVGPTAVGSSGRTFSNGFIVFDFQSLSNYKLAGIEAANDLLVISQVVNGTYTRLASRSVRFDPGIDYSLSAVITNSQATITVNGTNAVSRSFSGLLGGKVGIGTVNADTVFDNITVTG